MVYLTAIVCIKIHDDILPAITSTETMFLYNYIGGNKS